MSVLNLSSKKRRFLIAKFMSNMKKTLLTILHVLFFNILYLPIEIEQFFSIYFSSVILIIQRVLSADRLSRSLCYSVPRYLMCSLDGNVAPWLQYTGFSNL